MELNKDLTYILTDSSYPDIPRGLIDFESQENYFKACALDDDFHSYVNGKSISHCKEIRKQLSMDNAKSFEVFLEYIKVNGCKFTFVELPYTFDVGNI